MDANKREKEKIAVVFKLHESHEKQLLQSIDGVKQCRIEIIYKSKVDRRIEIYLKQLYTATSLAQQIAVGNDVDFPDRLHMEIANEIDSGGLDVEGFWENNTEQHHAIRRSLKSRFKLIQGPPGTGKTYIGVKLVYLFNKFNDLLHQRSEDEKKKIIFCGPSNRSVDLVARLVIEKLKTFAPRIVRLYGSAHENLDYPVPGKTSVSKRKVRDSKTDSYLVENGVVMHHIIREEGKKFAKELKKYDEQFKMDLEDLKRERSSKIKTSMEDIKKFKNILLQAVTEELKKYDVIFCTSSLVTNPKLLKATRGSIYQLIIDESGMCSEPGTIAPIIATRAKQVTLIGDHKQLRPIVKCSDAVSLGLERSLFERYSTNIQVNTMLKVQYRMHPAICHFPSKQFYNDELKTNPGTGLTGYPLTMWPAGQDYPIVFCHIEGEEETLTVRTEEGNQQSRSNKQEVYQVMKVLTHMINHQKVPQECINIMSQYNAQCHAIRESITDGGFHACTVSTVVSSQGGEWDYVIFSLVRSVPSFKIPEQPTKGWCQKQLGFITDSNQINVALTRARKGLVLIGNRNLLNCDEVWKELLKQYQAIGCVVDGSEFP